MHTKNIYREKALEFIHPQLIFNKPIMVVEDQLSVAKFTKAKLQERWQCEVMLSHDYKSTRALIEQHKNNFQVAVTDLHLPDAQDDEIIDLLLQAQIPILVLSASFNEATRATILNKGAVDYILKNSPNTYEYIGDVIERLEKNKSTKILLVDDSESALQLLQNMLSPLLFQILTAKNGKEALSILAQEPDIKLIITDYRMPEMDGFELTLNVRKHYPRHQLCIIGLSASDNTAISAQFLKHGANDYLNKPYSYEELFCRINQNLSMLDQMDAIQQIAYVDYLTGLYNRRFFFEKGQHLFKKAKLTKAALVIAVMDIDYFKKINDLYGHDGGDLVLVEVSALLKQSFQQDALLGRLGGEEFAVLFNTVDLNTAKQRLENFRQALENTKIRIAGKDVTVTISIGMTEILNDTFTEMVKKADENLYYAKARGRNCMIVDLENL
ncbi:MAG: diguanylate cyclase [Methylococcaceae bacterium]|jgi:diguanylate cyclase (GGDEF)-like protein